MAFLEDAFFELGHDGGASCLAQLSAGFGVEALFTGLFFDPVEVFDGAEDAQGARVFGGDFLGVAKFAPDVGQAGDALDRLIVKFVVAGVAVALESAAEAMQKVSRAVAAALSAAALFGRAGDDLFDAGQMGGQRVASGGRVAGFLFPGAGRDGLFFGGVRGFAFDLAGMHAGFAFEQFGKPRLLSSAEKLITSGEAFDVTAKRRGDW